MSNSLLVTLIDANAFVPSPLLDDLITCHVPFDELVDERRVESALEELARRGVAVALAGPSGSGKSAVCAYALARVTTDFAPIRVPVFYETEATIREPGAFARYVLQRLSSEAEAVEALDQDERDRLLREASERLVTPSRTIGHSVGGEVQLPWLLKADAARDVSTTIAGADLSGSTDAVLHAIDRVIDAIQAQGLTPMIVIDDTDRWLRVGDIDRRDLVGAFFGKIVRMLAERGCGLVVAAHDSYLQMDEYTAGTRGFLTDTVRLPRLSSPSRLGTILQHRIDIQIDHATVSEAADDEAIERLYHYYERDWDLSIRWALQAAHEALSAAVGSGAEKITASMIDDAAASYSR